MHYFARPMRTLACLLLSIMLAGVARAQVQVELRFKRVQYVAYEPVIATVQITNLAGRDIELRDDAQAADRLDRLMRGAIFAHPY